MNILNIFYVGLGGAIGAIVRFSLSFLLSPALVQVTKGTYILPTLIVNCLGCFLAGLLWVLKEKLDWPEPITTALSFGLLGALTTFSTFTLDTFRLYQKGHIGLAFGNVLLNQILCFIFIALGFYLAKNFILDSRTL